MFSEEEIAALVLGSRWVADRADDPLATAAHDALAKISAVLPADLRDELDASSLLVGPGKPMPAGEGNFAVIRRAIRTERKLRIGYNDRKQARSTRTIWPFALAFFDRVRVVVAWCELRRDFRHFRTDRITRLTMTEIRYPKRRQALLKEWRALEGIAEAAE